MQSGSLLLLVATLFLPGLAAGAAAGLRGWLLAAASPLLSYGIIALAAPVLPAVFGGWSWAGFALAVALISFALLGIRLLVRLRTGSFAVPHALPTRWRLVQHVAVAATVLAATAVGLYVVANATNGFTAIHQFWDAIFHANAVRFIAETGQSDAAALRSVVGSDGVFYYPNAFHVQLATTLGIDGGPLVDLLNLRAGITAGVLSLSMVALVRQTVGRPALALAVAAMSAAFSAFPHDLAFFGPLWPFATGVALLPAFMAVLVAALNGPHPATVAVTALGMIGLAAIHPSIALAAMILGLALVVQRWVGRRRIPLRDVAVIAGAGALASAYLLPVLIVSSQLVRENPTDWPAVTTPGDATFQLLTLQHEANTPQGWLIGAMIIGLLGVWYIRRLVWLLVGGVVFGALFVLSASTDGELVAMLTDPWWNDRWRFAALATPALVLLAGSGLVVVRDVLLELPSYAALRRDPLIRVGVLLAVVALFAVLSERMYVDRNVARVANAYRNGPMVSTDEQVALGTLAKLAPPNTMIMNDSNDGSAWMWALHDLRPVFGHALPVGNLSVVDADRALLYNHFDELDTDPAVRAIIRRMQISYVFVGEGLASPSSTRAPGLDDLGPVDGLELVYANREARIYRVDLDRPPSQQRGGAAQERPATLGS